MARLEESVCFFLATQMRLISMSHVIHGVHVLDSKEDTHIHTHTHLDPCSQEVCQFGISREVGTVRY